MTATTQNLLEKARARAEAENTNVTFIQHDAATFKSEPVFDAAIGLCEGDLIKQ